MPELSTKPYLLRAIYEWCTDSGYTPYVVAAVDAHTRVPREFVKNGEIVLNISFDATSNLKMENETIRFNARFSGVSREISIPVENVAAIYARENGQGMAFDLVKPAADAATGSEASEERVEASPSNAAAPILAAVPSPQSEAKDSAGVDQNPPDDSGPPKKGGRPTLTRIK